MAVVVQAMAIEEDLPEYEDDRGHSAHHPGYRRRQLRFLSLKLFSQVRPALTPPVATSPCPRMLRPPITPADRNGYLYRQSGRGGVAAGRGRHMHVYRR